MPIYAYRCAACGHAQDVLQKMSDPLLTVCPACGAAAYAKQVTAAGFQLKGSGWYVTDFRGGAGAKKDEAAAAAEAKGGDKAADAPAPKTDAKAERKGDAKAESKAESKSEGKADSKPAAPPPAAAPPPSGS
jgi:putative FmdB family regulatory protein